MKKKVRKRRGEIRKVMTKKSLKIKKAQKKEEETQIEKKSQQQKRNIKTVRFF